MVNIITKYFLPEDYIKKLSGSEKIEYISKAKILIPIMFINTCMIFIVSGYWSLSVGILPAKFYFTPIVGFFYLMGCFHIYFTGNLTISSWLVLLTALVNPLQRSIHFGGLDSPVIGVFFLMIFVVSFLHNKFISFIYFLCVLAQGVYLFKNDFTPSEVVTREHSLAAFFFIATLVWGIAFITKNRKSQYGQELKDFEKIKTMNKIVTTLNHELHGPLTKAAAQIKIMRDTDTTEGLQVVTKSLNKITQILAEIENVENFDELSSKD